MNTLVIFYSFTGRTHYEAKRLSEQLGAERYEVYERKPRSMLNATFSGKRRARKHMTVAIEPIAVSMADYDRIIIMAPVWGGWPAPAFNSILKEVPEGKTIEIVLTSDSGSIPKPVSLQKIIEAKGVSVGSLKVMKTIDLKKRDKLHFKRKMQEEKEKENNRAE